MQPSDFTENSPGILVPIPEGVEAFVPHALPEALPLDAGTVRALSMAERALGQLTGILRTGARGLNPQLVTSPLLRREAISSSRIEGTVTTPEQLVLFEIDAGYEEPSSAQEAQTLEVHNYIRALHHGFARLREIPVCLRLIRELHEILMESVRGGDQQPGQFRSIQNFIGASRDIRAARFVPPPVSELDRCLREFEGYINSESEELPLLVRLALIHYQFETIHPFRDGNGRVGRLLLPLLLYSYDKIEGPVLYVSPYLEQNRSTYTELLLRVSQTGDFASWVRFFLTAVAESANESVARAEALFALRDGYYARLHSARSSALLLKLVDALFERPSMSIGNAAELLEITPASAVANLRRLQDEGIVTEVTGRRRDQRYVAREILSVAHRERP